MSEILLHVRVTINDAQVEKMNAKRVRLGRQTRTGAEDAINAIGEALQHNLMFERPIEVHEVSKEILNPMLQLIDGVVRPVPWGGHLQEIISALKNSGIDTECGACMEVAFTGATTNQHSCHSKSQVVKLGAGVDNAGRVIELQDEEGNRFKVDDDGITISG